ncbi:hypothetical protein DICVIV_06881 [Dictyocaulus viviparus]|uniref:Uncharacterized protein n=1 Tax=Dictyocaulus viviparus TaxID=29172 RepID=A0A0D8XTD7_DICVI|nr:hypothetical protein DICVIV_06881 [Dictyocaulus viviparus]
MITEVAVNIHRGYQSNYAKDWYGSDVALVQHPLLGGENRYVTTISAHYSSSNTLECSKINFTFGSEGWLLENAAAKPSKPGNPVALPTIVPYVISWKNLEDARINDENIWNFEKRVDSKVWWPS